jgi:hypothetical protein
VTYFHAIPVASHGAQDPRVRDRDIFVRHKNAGQLRLGKWTTPPLATPPASSLKERRAGRIGTIAAKPAPLGYNMTRFGFHLYRITREAESASTAKATSKSMKFGG